MYKALMFLCSLMWATYFITFCVGVYEPDNFTIGLAFIITATYFLRAGVGGWDE